MALLAMYGFDDANAAEPGTANKKGATGRTGVNGCSWTGTSAFRTPDITAMASGVIGFAINGQRPAGTTPVTTGAVLYLASNTSRWLEVWLDTTGHLNVKVGGSTSATTPLAVSSSVLQPSVWYYIEWKFNVLAGTSEIRVNGDTWISLTGIPTSNLSSIDNLTQSPLFSGGNSQVDDMYMLDLTGSAPYNDFLGDVQVYPVHPNGNGSNAQWLGTDGNSVDNYLLVDEDPANTTDYVSASVAGKSDSYLMGDVPAGYSILAVQHDIYAAKSDTGTPPGLAITSKTSGGATVQQSAALAGLSTTWQRLQGQIRTTDPNGSAWTQALVNSLEVGVKTL